MELINLGNKFDDSMDYSLIKGHVSDEEFNKVFAEKWHGGDPIEGDRISHEYWVESKDGSWKSSNKNDPKAVPVTVTDW